MYNNELRASLLMEAADLLAESAGINGKKSKELNKEAARNGVRYYTRRDVGRDAAKNHRHAIEDAVDQKSRIREAQKHPDDIAIYRRLKNRDDFKNISKHKVEAWTNGYQTHDQLINERGKRAAAIKESIDLLYDKAALCESAEETEYYINQALELSELL